MTAGRAGQGARIVLVTRPVMEQTIKAAIEALGFRAVAAPLLRVRTRGVAVPAGVQAILVTSSNALPALSPSHLPLLAVGEATARRARERGFAQVSSADGDAALLAGLAAGALDPACGALLLASGARQGHALAADLRARGFRVVRRVCYEAIPMRHFSPEATEAINSGLLHAAMFLSAETAAAFVRLLPLELRPHLATVAALAIGNSTAELLEALPWLRVCRAAKPTLNDVLALI